MAAALACRRVLLLPAPATPAPPRPAPIFLSSTRNSAVTSSLRGQPPPPSSRAFRVADSASARVREACAPSRQVQQQQQSGRISWRRLANSSCSWSSASGPRVSFPTNSTARHRPSLLFVPSRSSVRLRRCSQGLQATLEEGHASGVAEARARGAAARQLWKTHSTALSSARPFGGVFFQPTPHKKSDRIGCMAAAGSGKSGGFATSSVVMETVNARGAQNARGDSQKLVTFEAKDGQITVGVIRGDALWSLQDVLKAPDGKPLPQVSDMESVIKNWSDLKDRLVLEGSGTKASEVRLLAPIPKPAGVIMCIGKNYLDHVKEVDTWKTAPEITKPEAPKHPIVFTKAPQSVIGPGAAIKYPHGVSSAVDYEAELGVIIGKSGQSIKREDAMSYIFGYTIINDVTARDLQKRHQQWFLGKSCDTFCPMGPAIVPASEIDGTDLQIQCWINDELRQDGRTSQMLFGIPVLIEVISAAITLQPGDIIATGTPAGVGSGFNPPRHLTPGDKIRIYIEGIGELCNVVE